MSGHSDTKERVRYIDLARGIAIFLVVLGHAVPVGTAAKRLIYSFHMPLFFIISGLAGSGRVISFPAGAALRARIRVLSRRVLMPYLIWALIFAPLSFRNLAGILYGSRQTLVKAGSLSSLWYLPVFFLAEILAECVSGAFSGKRYALFKNTAAAAVLIAAGLLLPRFGRYGYPWGINIVPVAAGMILLGMAAHPLILKLSVPADLLSAAGLAVLYAAVFLGPGTSMKKNVLMAEASYRNPGLFVLLSLTGSFAVICAAHFLTAAGLKARFLSFAGRHTMGIFILHKLFIEAGQKLAERAGFAADGPAAILMITAAAFISSALISSLAERAAPELFGRKRDRHE